MGDAPRDPLTPEELDLLQTRLVEKMESAGCMPLDVAHGFLSATAPRGDQDEAELLGRVLGEMADDQQMSGLLSRFRAQLLTDLRVAEYGPLILQMPRDDGSMLPLPYGWCQGYMGGLDTFDAAQRDALLADEEAGSLLTPILALMMYDETQWFDPPNETEHRETVGQLGDVAVGIFRWWKSRLDS